MYDKMGYELLTTPAKVSSDLSDQLVKTRNFMEGFGLSSINKMAPYNSKSKAVLNGDVTLDTPRSRLFILQTESSVDLLKTIELLEEHADIESAEPDYVTKGGGTMVADFFGREKSIQQSPNDAFYSIQWGLENTGQIVAGYTGTDGEDINPDGAWEITEGSEDILVAVLDSGLPDNVPDMAGRIVDGYNFVSGNGNTADDHGHGTSVASIALSTGNNSSMISGVESTDHANQSTG